MTIKKLMLLASIGTFVATLALPLATPAVAEDLTDNATCLECHADEPRAAPENSDRPRVHTDTGGFNVEDHEMWSCVDCHTYIVEIPHSDELVAADNEVDCTNCHDEAPTK